PTPDEAVGHRGGGLWRSRLRKINRRKRGPSRRWLRGLYQDVFRLRYCQEPMEVARVQDLASRELAEQYLAHSRPVIVTNAVDRWSAAERWSLEFFESQFGDRVVGQREQSTNLGEGI